MTDAPSTRLTLVTPELAGIEAFEPAFRAALAAGDIAAVTIRLLAADDRTLIARAKPLIDAAQEAGAAAILSGPSVADMLGKSGADGIELDADDAAFADAVERFAPKKIVGARAGRSRDVAMSAGEAGADYVLFGKDFEGAFADTLERVSWWVPIFETPCVGLAPTLDDAAAIAAAEAEFAALGEAVWRHPGGPAAAVAAAFAMLSLGRAPRP